MPSRTLSEAEYDAVKQKVLDSLPAGLSEENYNRRVSSAMAGALAEAENSPPMLTGSSVGRFASGAWSNLNPLSMLSAVTPQAVGHLVGVDTVGPVQTVKNVAGSQLAELSKAVESAKAGRYSEMAGHGAAGLLPVIGPAAAHAGEQIGQGNIAGGLGEGAGLLAPYGADAAITRGPEAAIGVAKRVVPADSLNALADRMQTSATNRLATELGPKVGPGKVKLTNSLAKVAPDLLRDPELGAITKERFAQKVSSKLDEAKSAIDDANDARLASQQVKTGPLVKALDDQINRLTASPAEGSQVPRSPNVPSGPTRAQQLAGITGEIAPGDVATTRPIGAAVEPAPNAAQIATLRQIRSEVAQLGPVAPYEAVRRIREAWDKPATAKYLSSTAEDAVKSQGAATGAMKGTGALREALAATDPTSAAAYRQYSIFKAADDVLTATQEAERARPTVGRNLLRTTGGAVAGAASAGGVGAVIGATVGWIADRAASYAPTMQITIARRLQAIADALRQGRPEQAQAMAITLKANLPPEFAPTDAPVAPTPQVGTNGDRRFQELQTKFGGRGQ